MPPTREESFPLQIKVRVHVPFCDSSPGRFQNQLHWQRSLKPSACSWMEVVKASCYLFCLRCVLARVPCTGGKNKPYACVPVINNCLIPLNDWFSCHSLHAFVLSIDFFMLFAIVYFGLLRYILSYDACVKLTNKKASHLKSYTFCRSCFNACLVVTYERSTSGKKSG